MFFQIDMKQTLKQDSNKNSVVAKSQEKSSDLNLKQKLKQDSTQAKTQTRLKQKLKQVLKTRDLVFLVMPWLFSWCLTIRVCMRPLVPTCCKSPAENQK